MPLLLPLAQKLTLAWASLSALTKTTMTLMLAPQRTHRGAAAAEQTKSWLSKAALSLSPSLLLPPGFQVLLLPMQQHAAAQTETAPARSLQSTRCPPPPGSSSAQRRGRRGAPPPVAGTGCHPVWLR